MEPVSSRQVTPRFALSLLAVAVLSAGSGCVSLDSFSLKGNPHKGEATQMVAAWDNKIRFVPDPTRNNAPAPGIMGRLYQFGPELGFPLIEEGTLTVELSDVSPARGRAVVQPRLMERWIFDPETFAKLRSKDTVGMGYTLFLPWGTYRPDITVVQLTAQFEPKDRAKIVINAPISKLTLNHDQALGDVAPIAGLIPGQPTMPSTPPTPNGIPTLPPPRPLGPGSDVPPPAMQGEPVSVGKSVPVHRPNNLNITRVPLNPSAETGATQR